MRGEPGITRGVETGVVGIEIDEAALNQEVTYFEDVTPASGVRNPGAPGAFPVLARARAFDGEDIGAGHDPVEGRVVVEDVRDAAAEVGKELKDLLLAV